MNGITRKEWIMTCGRKLFAMLGITLLSIGICLLSVEGMMKAPSISIVYAHTEADQSIQSENHRKREIEFIAADLRANHAIDESTGASQTKSPSRTYVFTFKNEVLKGWWERWKM